MRMPHTCDKWFYITTQTGNKSMKLARKQLLLLFLLDAFKIKHPMIMYFAVMINMKTVSFQWKFSYFNVLFWSLKTVDCVFRSHWTHQCSVLTLCSNRRWLFIWVGVRVVNYPHQSLWRFLSNWNCKQNLTCKAKHIPQPSCSTVISFVCALREIALTSAALFNIQILGNP